MCRMVAVCHLPRTIATLPDPGFETEGEIWRGWGFSRSWDCCMCNQATLLLVITPMDCLTDCWFVSQGDFVRPLGFHFFFLKHYCIPVLVFSINIWYVRFTLYNRNAKLGTLQKHQPLQITAWSLKTIVIWDFPGGAVVKNPPANAGDTGSSPGPGRSHMPRSN